MIKFITEEQESAATTFSDVECDQFFVADQGFLYQKVGHRTANVIADTDGVPHAVDSFKFCAESKVERILPRVTKIEF